MPRVPVSNYPTRGTGTRHPHMVNRTGFPLNLENLENHGKPGKPEKQTGGSVLYHNSMPNMGTCQKYFV